MIVKLNTCLISFILYYSYVGADFIIEELNDDKHLCISICTDNISFLSAVKDGKSICEKGCRFFNIIYLTDQNNINNTRQQCHLSCKEAYDGVNDNAACTIGCDIMSKKKEDELTSILQFIRQENSRNFLLEAEIEILESDILSDPMIKSQVEQGYNVEYRIPETKIRTMPIAEIIERRMYEAKAHPSGDWLDCASRNSGIPKSILLISILVATLVVLILLMTSAKYNADEQPPLYLADDLDKSEGIYEVGLNYDKEKKVNLSDMEEKKSDDDATLIDNEIQFSEPLKYDIGTYKV